MLVLDALTPVLGAASATFLILPERYLVLLLPFFAGGFLYLGAGDLLPRQAAVLLELCRYRDQVAASLNRPLFKVIGDATLLSIAAALPRSLDDLNKYYKGENASD